jgi:type 2 lantibiotic biosynthesis protein LanM
MVCTPVHAVGDHAHADRASDRMSAPASRLSAFLEDPAWYLALTLSERLALGRADAAIPAAAPRRGSRGRRAADRRAAGRRAAARGLDAWRAQSPFMDEAWWAQRLAFDGLDEEQLSSLLAEPGESVAARCPVPPPWLCRLAEAFAQPCAPTEARADAHTRPETAPAVAYATFTSPPVAYATFTTIVSPLLDRAFARVLDRARELARANPGVPFAPDAAAALLYESLPQRVDLLLARTVVLEMHVARMRGALEGDTPEARFRGFVAGLAQPDRALALLREYPVLARLLAQTTGAWAEAAIELLERLVADWTLIRSTFCPDDDPGTLSEVSGGLGDAHASGRSVLSLGFSAGFRIIYKPRPMAIDVWFGALLDWLNARGAPGLRAPRVLDRGGHGWAELVTPRPCASRDQVARFYQRQGAFLALLYGLNANDIHHENLIADGEHPVLIDLESLCGADHGHSDPDSYDSMAEFELDNSVMRVMLLPYFHEGLGRIIADTSGIGADAGQLAVHASADWDDWGTDRMRLVYRRREIPPAPNRPSVDGHTIDPFEYAEHIERGFVSMYQLLIERRDELLAGTSPLAGLRDIEVRAVLRASQFYGFILRDSTHPDLLRNALERDRHFDRMWFGIDRSKLADLSLRILRGEQGDLWRGDIPCFRARGGSRHLWTATGACVPDFFRSSGIEALRARLQRMGEDDLARQRWFLRASLTALAVNLAPDMPQYRVAARPETVHRDDLLRVAVRAGERLAATARWNQNGASWLGLAWTKNRGWWLRPLEYDLYSGLPGVAMFLAYLGQVTGRQDFSALARGAVATLRRQLERRPHMVQYLGSYDGWAGVIYAWMHLATLWQEDALLDQSLGFLPRLSAMIDRDGEIDLMRGSAGGILPLLDLHRITGAPEPLALARRMGDRLVSTARPAGAGRAWLTSAAPHWPLTGLSHGAAGAAWALTELYAATTDPRYRSLALDAVAFEDGYLSPEHGNWFDLRGGVDQAGRPSAPVFMAAWCHGAGGIALSRLQMLRCIDDPRLREDAELALATMVRKGLRVGHCLCHGDAGVLDVLLLAARVLDPASGQAAIAAHLPLLMASIEEHGFLCGVPLDVETPGLMDGIAGIGYGLLRLAAPEQVPSILALEPPRVAAGVS